MVADDKHLELTTAMLDQIVLLSEEMDLLKKEYRKNMADTISILSRTVSLLDSAMVRIEFLESRVLFDQNQR